MSWLAERECPGLSHLGSTLAKFGLIDGSVAHLQSAEAFMAFSACCLVLYPALPISTSIFPSGFFATTSHLFVLAFLATQNSVAANAGMAKIERVAKAMTLRRNILILLGCEADPCLSLAGYAVTRRLTGASREPYGLERWRDRQARPNLCLGSLLAKRRFSGVRH